MKTFPKVCSLIAVLELWFVIGAFGNQDPASEITSTTPWTFPIDCRPYHMKSMKVLLKAVSTCTRKLKANSTSNKDYDEHLGCAIKCAMRLLGCLDNGIVTQESILRATRTLLPEPLVQPVVKMFKDNCLEKFAKLLDPNDPHCKSYSEYGFCIQSTIGDLVDSEYCIKHTRAGKGTSAGKKN